MSKRYLSTLCCAFLFMLNGFAQDTSQNQDTPVPTIGVPGACGPGNATNKNGPNPTPQNGSGSLGQTYNFMKCGLNFVTASQRLGQRFSPAGVAQPAPFAISGIPACATIEKAYLWVGTSGNGVAITATITNPASVTGNYPMTIIGSGPDKCWSYSGTYTYRADVTAAIAGNGNYMISGIPVNSPNDADGATLIVIYSNPAATYRGHIIIHDGCVVMNGGTTTQTVTGINACSASTSAVAFCCVGDLQMAGTCTMNGTNAPFTWNWWNYIQVNTTVTNAQANSSFVMSSSGDCFNLAVTGLYYQTTNCVTCSSTSTITANATSTPASCSNCNGTATANVTSGTPPYTYSWAPSGGTGATATGLCAGTYTVTVTGSAACSTPPTTTATVTVTSSGGSITVNGTPTNVSCFGGCNGSVSSSVSGGTAPYTYSWAPSGGTGPNASGLCAGTYTLTVTDANGCTGTNTFTITQPAALAATQSQTNITCNAACNGTATVSASGGTAPYTYSWAPSGGTGATASGICAGTYTCTITDSKGCVLTRTFTLTQPTALTATITSTNVTCNAACNGIATVTAGGGTPGYTYSWAPSGGTGATASGLCAGSYTVTVTDAASCTKTATITITQPTALTANITASTNVTCNAACNGTATVTAGGGTPGYTYSWAPSGGTGATASGLCAGSYTVTVTDAASCTKTATITITQPPALTATITASANVICNAACNGSATVTAGGGTPGYTYSWAPSGGIGATASSLCAGSYTVTITDASSCTKTASVTITQPTALAVTTTQVDVSCNGGTNGTATATAAGGTPGYTYSWNTTPVQTTATATGLGAGPHIVTVTDANGCTKTATVTITQPTALTITTSSTTSTCGSPNGTVTAAPAGGTPGYTYSWNTTPVQTTSTATALTPGSYAVTVTDANGCTATSTVTVANASGGTASITSSTNVSCFGGSNGSATSAITGGTGPFSYSWAPSGGTNATATGLTAGLYTVTITDANNCPTTASVTITEPSTLAANITASTNVTCNAACNGSATVSASGGTTPYSYSWAPSGGTGATAGSLCAGAYTVTITDANGCTATASVTITQPTALTVTTTQVDIPCNGGSNGSATATAVGGTPSYSYSWNTSPVQTTATATGLTAGVYIVTVTDANGCTVTSTVTITQPTALTLTTTTTTSTCGNPNGTATVNVSGGTPTYSYSWNTTPAQTTSTATGLPANPYVVTVTDGNGCTATASVTVSNAAGGTPSIGSVMNVLCNGGSNGSATVTMTGGTGPFTYSWAPSGGTNATATGLSAGTYTVTVTDANNCAAIDSVTISEPSQAVCSVPAFVNVNCFGACNGAATAQGTGGTSPYTFSWAPIGATGATVTNLCAGSYTVTMTDANGCTSTGTVIITEPPQLTLSVAGFNTTCNGVCDGQVVVIPSGGTPGYTYSWSPGCQAASCNNLCPGSYAVTVTDMNGCTATGTASVSEPTAITLTTSSVTSNCNQPNGSATVNASGGTPGYTYSWNTTPAQTDTTATGLVPNTYVVTVTDFNQCTATASVVVTNTPGVAASILSSVNTTCFGSCDGSATAAGAGGTLPYSYSWSTTPVQTNATATGLCAGVYTVTITDGTNCSDTAIVTITEPTQVQVTPNPVAAICIGQSASVSATASGGNGPYTYTWCGSQTGNPVTMSPAVTTPCTVMATDANGCTSAVQNFTVTVYPALTVVATGTGSICPGGTLALNATGGGGNGGPYSYSWSPSAGLTSSTGASPSASPALTTTYTVTVTDNCTSQSATATVTVTVNPLPVPSLTSNVTSGCVPLCVDFTDQCTIASGTVTGWSWDLGNGTSSVQNPGNICYTTAGTYSVTLTATSDQGCVASTTVPYIINAYPIPVPNFTFGPQPTTILNSQICFTDSSSGATSWSWDFNDPTDNATSTIQNPCHTYSDTGTYCVTLTVTNANGCDSTIVSCLVISPDFTIYVPNAFTPNGDGVNDWFFPQGTGLRKDNFKMMLFDRWGNMMYFTEDPDKGWDGHANGGSDIAQQDVYVWKIEVKDVFNASHIYMGHVTLIK